MGSSSQFLTGMSPEDGLLHSVQMLCFHMSKEVCSAYTILKCFLYNDSLKMDTFAPISITIVTDVPASINQTPRGGSTFQPHDSARGINGLQM